MEENLKERIASLQEQTDHLIEERNEHEEEFDNLNLLIKCLKYVDMHNLANDLSQLKLSFKKSSGKYIKEEIDLEVKEREYSLKSKTTRKEYKQIKKNIIKLSKEATRMAKKYKDLYELYLGAGLIILDMRVKGIINPNNEISYEYLYAYFNQPKGEYYYRNPYNVNDYYLREASNLGYEYLAFYRDYNSSYNEVLRNNGL